MLYIVLPLLAVFVPAAVVGGIVWLNRRIRVTGCDLRGAVQLFITRDQRVWAWEDDGHVRLADGWTEFWGGTCNDAVRREIHAALLRNGFDSRAELRRDMEKKDEKWRELL